MTVVRAETTPPLCARPTLAYARGMDRAPLEDSALMLRYKDGDLAAFEELYRRHNDALYRYFLRLGGDRTAAEDLYQEAWTKIIRARANYQPTAKFTTFLYRVAHNCFIDYLRRNERHRRKNDFDPDQQPAVDDSPEMVTESHMARERLEHALNSLPDEQRDAFLLHEEAGLSIDDIAKVTGANREAAKSRLRYAVRKLRAAIDEPEVST